MKKLIYSLLVLLTIILFTPLSANCKSISEYGAIGDDSADDSIAFQKSLNETGTLDLEAGKTYHLSKGLLFPSSTVINGNGATLIIDDVSFFMDENNPKENNGKGLFYYQFFFPQKYNSTSELLEINNLTINWNVEKPLTHVNTYYLFILNDISKVSFNSVSININGYSNNSIQPIKFNSKADNVTFDKCSIYNYAHGNDGSCIWFHANKPSGYPNVTITNSYFYSEAHDEMISAWGPYKKKVNISNCVFQRHCVPCVSTNKKTITPNRICLASKSTQVLSGQYNKNYDSSSSIVYENCNFYVTSESSSNMPYYFITSSSYYGSPIKTYFRNCNITGCFAKGFIGGEESFSSEADGNVSNANYQANIGIFFDNCNLNLAAPTLLSTRSVNTTFSNCSIKTNNVIMDTLYVDNNLIMCSCFNFTNNSIVIQNDIPALFKDLSPEQCNQLYVHNNTFFCTTSKNIKLYTETDHDYSSYKKSHSLNANSVFSFINNTILQDSNK